MWGERRVHSLNSLCDHQGIKLQILNWMRGGVVPSQLSQNPPLSPPPLPFPPTLRLSTGPTPERGRGDPAPPQGKFGDTPPAAVRAR